MRDRDIFLRILTFFRYVKILKWIANIYVPITRQMSPLDAVQNILVQYKLKNDCLAGLQEENRSNES